MKIYIIINGTEVTIDANPTNTIRELAEIALKETEDYPRPDRPLDDWIIQGEHQSLCLYKTLEEEKLKFQNGNLAFMTIKAGTGA